MDKPQLSVNVPLPAHWSEAEVKAATEYGVTMLRALDGLALRFFEHAGKAMPEENAYWVTMVALMSAAAMQARLLDATEHNFMRLAREVFSGPAEGVPDETLQ